MPFYTLGYRAPCRCGLARRPSQLDFRSEGDIRTMNCSLWLVDYIDAWEVRLVRALASPDGKISLSYHFLSETVANSEVCREHSNNKNIR